jgi:hypothetical protein
VKGDIQCTPADGMFYTCMNTSKCDKLNLDTVYDYEDADYTLYDYIWESNQLDIIPVFILKERTDVGDKNCVDWDEVVDADYEWYHSFGNNDFACADKRVY